MLTLTVNSQNQYSLADEFPACIVMDGEGLTNAFRNKTVALHYLNAIRTT